MLEQGILVAGQVLILFLLMAVGFAARKSHLIHADGQKQMTNLLLIVVTPLLIIQSFQKDFDPAFLRGLLFALASALLSHLLGIALATLVFRHQAAPQRKVLRFSVVFSNSAFMCIPLLQALLGPDGVFYGSVYVAMLYILQWTYGVVLMTGRREDVHVRQVLFNPGTIGLVIGLIFFLIGFRLPSLLLSVSTHLTNLNTPLAMLVIGGQLATVDLKTVFKGGSVWQSVLLRLLAVPLLLLGFLHLAQPESLVFLSCLIPASAPSAAAVALFAARYDQDEGLASRLVALSTVLSILTMPVMIILAGL